MNAYKFEVSISDKGVINLPLKPELLGTTAEIFIVIKFKEHQKNETLVIDNNQTSDGNQPPSEKQTMGDFLNKWAGFLTVDDADTAKYEYLLDKYK